MLRSFRPLVLAALIGATACAHAKIQNTQIEDTPENRAVYDVVDAYQRAFRNRDAPALLELVSPKYYEDNGNIDRSDDYDKNGLAKQLEKDFARTENMQLDLAVNDIVIEDETKAYAYIEYTVRAQNDFPAGQKWQTDADRARIVLERDGKKWLIVSGI